MHTLFLCKKGRVQINRRMILICWSCISEFCIGSNVGLPCGVWQGNPMVFVLLFASCLLVAGRGTLYFISWYMSFICL